MLLQGKGASVARLTGSGAAVYGMFQDGVAAESARASLAVGRRGRAFHSCRDPSVTARTKRPYVNPLYSGLNAHEGSDRIDDMRWLGSRCLAAVVRTS